VFLACTGCFVDEDELHPDSPLIRVLADDIAWRFDVADWQRRQPPWWSPRRVRRWRAEFEILAQEQNRIAVAARFYGVPD
jgi:hypothetical protein